MATEIFFEEVENGTAAKPKAPLWTIDLDDPGNEDAALKWLNGEVAYLQDQNKERFQLIQRNMALYKGIQYQEQETRVQARDRNEELNRTVQKLVANHLYDLVQQKKSKQLKYKPAVAILPTNDEFGDKVSAKNTKALLDHIWYVENFDGEVVPELLTLAYIQGESYLFETWDPDKGDLHPDYKKMKGQSPEEDVKVPLLNDKGEPVLDDMGKPIEVTKEIHVGDVTYKVRPTTQVLLHRKHQNATYKDAEYIFIRDIYSVDEAKVLWPKKADKIKAQRNVQTYDYESMMLETYDNSVVVWSFYHKKTKTMPKGRWIQFTQDSLLLNKKHPYSHGDFPCTRLTDIDLPQELHGQSSINMVKGLTGAYNNMTNMINRNQVLVGHPKWMLPAGAAKIESLGNDITVVQFKGPVAPALVQANPTSPETFSFRKELKEEFQQIYGVYGTSRGEPPKGITAAVALQYLGEQESERANESVLKFNEAIRQIAIKTIAVCGDYYDSSDARMIRILGKNNQWMSVFFDATNLSKDYDIRIQNSSALPQSKAARTQTLIDLNQAFPNMVSQEQVMDLLDMAQSDKFLDITTVSIRAAEAENEMLQYGKEIPEPQEYEDHIQHWKVHVRMMQEYAFKNMTPPEIQARLNEHVMATEMLMIEKAKVNPAFMAKLQELAIFPVAYTPEPEITGQPAGSPNLQEIQNMTQGMYENQQLPIEGAEPQQAVTPEGVPPMVDQLQEGNIPEQVPGPIEPTGAV